MGLSLSIYLGPYLEIEGAADDADLYSLVGDALTPVETIYGVLIAGIPNERRGGPNRFWGISSRDTSAHRVEPERIEPERQWLARAFADELRILDEAFGGERVTVRWGLVCRYS